jgi:hypothetical protein
MTRNKSGTSRKHRPARTIIWLATGAVVVVAVALSVTFAITHTNGTSAPTGPSGNVQPQSGLQVIDDCANTGRIEPVSIILACGTGSTVAHRLRWTEWDSDTAVGTGSIDEVSCVPNCASGADITYHVRLTLSAPVRAGSGTRYFTLITVSYLGKGPSGSRTTVYKDCYDTPPAPYLPRCPASEQGAA